jgi:hypothetical protein
MAEIASWLRSSLEGERMTDFFDYAERNGFWLFPLRANTKMPAVKWSQPGNTSPNPEQWRSWEQQFPGCNWAVACAHSGIIGVEIDPKARRDVNDKASEQVGSERADAAWKEQLTEWGLPWLAPHVRSRSGGHHYYFRPPIGVSVNDMTQRGLKWLSGFDQTCVDTRCKGYLLVPPSQIDGAKYTLGLLANDIYNAPDALVSTLLNPPRTKAVNTVADIAAPKFDYDRVARWIDRKVQFKWIDLNSVSIVDIDTSPTSRTP